MKYAIDSEYIGYEFRNDHTISVFCLIYNIDDENDVCEIETKIDFDYKEEPIEEDRYSYALDTHYTATTDYYIDYLQFNNIENYDAIKKTFESKFNDNFDEVYGYVKETIEHFLDVNSDKISNELEDYLKYLRSE